MVNLLPIKQIYCDTAFKRKDSISNSNFKIDLPQTLKLPDNCVCFSSMIYQFRTHGIQSKPV